MRKTLNFLVVLFISTSHLHSATYYVDQKHKDSSDDNAGTESKPWKTVVYAGKMLKASDKLIIKPGIYYGKVRLENSGEEGRPIVIEGTSLGDVIIDGSKKIKSWKRTKENPRVWEAEYTQKLAFTPPKTNTHLRCYVSSEPADLTINGIPLFWTNDGKFLPGNWKVDKKVNKIYVRLPDDTDPNTHLMEVISDDYGIDLGHEHGKVNYLIIRNLVIRRFLTAAKLFGNNISVENNIFEWCAYYGPSPRSTSKNYILRNNVTRWNGLSGLSTSFDGKIINNKILFTNWKLNSPTWGSQGFKIFYIIGGLIEGNEFAYNGGLGLWNDYGNDLILKNNIAHDNAHAGMENEASQKATWTGNVSYRNKCGFVNNGSSNIILKGNIFSDNRVNGIQYNFRRTRVPDWGVNWLKKNFERYQKNTSKEVACDWLSNYLTYGFPCLQIRNNLTEKNLLINNKTNFNNAPPKQLPDPGEKHLISGNVFEENILVNSNPEDMVAGYSSLAQYQEKTDDGAQCLSFSKINTPKFPEWARKLYEKHKARLTYPRSYQSVENIYKELVVKNAWCGYHYLTPSGTLALARICESETLKEKKFSDPFLKGYFITYKNKRTLVLWRKHGRPADFAPVLLKGIPENAILETAWDQEIPLNRKNGLVSINVGTWPIYIVGAGENIVETLPFTLKTPENFEYGKPMEFVLENPIGNGTLFFDKYQGVEKCPDELQITGDKTKFSITLPKSAKNNFVEFRVAGHLNGLYAGRMIRMFTGKPEDETNRILKLKGFTPVSLKSVANCSLDGDSESSIIQMGKTKSLANIPEKMKVGEIPFAIGKGPKTCIGFNSNHVKGKARPDLVTIDLGGKKIKALAFLQVCAWAPKKVGTPLLKYSLNYDDYLVDSTYVKNGINVLDWWQPMTADQKKILNSNNTWKAWSGNCGTGHYVQVYMHIWKNPKPGVGVNSLQISTSDPDKSVLMGIIAVSVLEGNP